MILENEFEKDTIINGKSTLSKAKISQKYEVYFSLYQSIYQENRLYCDLSAVDFLNMRLFLELFWFILIPLCEVL